MVAQDVAASAENKAPSAHLDNALFPPRLDKIVLSDEAMAGPGPDYSLVLETICGVADDSQAVEQYDGTLGVTVDFVAAHEDAVAQVAWNDNLATVFTNPGNVNGARWGSGTMISPDLFLSCGHLFDADPNGWTIPRQNGSAVAISPQQAATSMHLNFEYQVDSSGAPRAEQSFAITQLVEFRLGGLDMSICRIAGSPGNIYGWAEVSTANAAVGDMLAIIGHPAGMRKRIEAGPATSVAGSVVGYNDIDTLGGNSGSGILQASTGRLIGVHTNGGCNPQGTGSNTGVAIAAIRAVSPTLQALNTSYRSAKANDAILTQFAGDKLGTGIVPDVIGSPIAQDLIQTAFTRDNKATILTGDATALARDNSTLLTGDVTVLGGDTGVRDQLGTTVGGDLGTIGLDNDPTFDPGSILVNPGIDLGALIGANVGGVRPFIQAGAHAVVEGAPLDPTPADARAELAAIIAQQTELLDALRAALEAVDAEIAASSAPGDGPA